MDSKINNLKIMIGKHKEKYPNICKLWLNYINEKNKSFDTVLNTASDIFKNIENIIKEDVSMNSIIILYLLNHNKL